MEKTFTESEIREVLDKMTTPCEDEIAITRRQTRGEANDVSASLPMACAEAGAELFVDTLLSGQRDAHDLRWRVVSKSAACSLAWMFASDPTPPGSDL